jgi:hypothetical protein
MNTAAITTMVVRGRAIRSDLLVRTGIHTMPPRTRLRVEQQFLVGEAQQLPRADRSPKCRMPRLLLAAFRFLLPDLRERKSKAVAAVKFAPLLGLLLTLANAHGPIRPGGGLRIHASQSQPKWRVDQ